MNTRLSLSLLAVPVVALLLTANLRAGAAPGTGTAKPAGARAAAPKKPAPKKPVKPAPKAQRKLIAYYFHGNYRCVSCKKIEALSEKAIWENFAREMKAGRIEWRVVNLDVKGNEHYAKDYKLYTRSVVLSDTTNGKQTRWKNLEKVWNLLGDDKAFKAYVRDEVAAYLKGA